MRSYSSTIKEPLLPAKLGSFRYTFEQRSKERLFASIASAKNAGASEWVFPGFEDGARRRGCFRRLRDAVGGAWGSLRAAVAELWRFGREDPRKAVFGAKSGLALALVSFIVFLKQATFMDLAKHCVWAILTVVVVFEFSIAILIPDLIDAI